MLNRALIDVIFNAAHIQRWNDHMRPFEFTELDKQAQKILIAYILGCYEEQKIGKEIDWHKLISGAVFEFLQRVTLTDLKPPLYYRLMSERGRELNQWVLKKLGGAIDGIKGDFAQNFAAYLLNDETSFLEKRILKAAHYLATHWEFQIIYNISPNLYGLEETKKNIDSEIEDHYDLLGVQKVLLKKKTYNLLDLFGQLRFQQRWAQTPRLPKTSVLGHMLMVAYFVYFLSLELNCCSQRIVNNFFAGLFHDLPEVLTRDIISPVKRSIAGLDELIKAYESQQIEEKILPLLPQSMHQKLLYFINDEFKNKVVIDNKVVFVDKNQLNKEFNQNCFQPLDGELLKAVDEYAAFLEATLSIEHGIKTKQLIRGREKILKENQDKKFGVIDFAFLYGLFASTTTF